ncbi:MAG: Hpt domain-containing protein [Bacillota bacterium]
MHKFFKDLYEDVGKDKELVAELKDDFLDIYAESIKPLEEAIESDNYKKMDHLAHKLKGSSLNFNTPKLTKYFEKIENEGKNNININSKKLLDKIKTEINKFENIHI